ncbi:ACP phosphodiesterase [Flavihumibacter solisilvae]|uniref:ACP phosphodiesterase n=1 Tax=Flavihumibacter solisilvae TaxID=1349421 RepID=A0A0C1L852_9BACT|nr:ACP phosphodiesterase [Flavihumibacter solisilvae]KIC96342.1 ACP phosphodiesterase [Flavihumibacter solisilvae]
MNFLAHAYLSFRQPEILAGNMISDFVKGKSRFDYPEGIQKGIMLHRAIDTFTDNHPLNSEAKKIFRPAVGLYAGAFLDVAYDHFLAIDQIAFPGESLPVFSQWVYSTLEKFELNFPERFAVVFPYMKNHDWLYNYRQRQGIQRSMEGLVRRAKFLDDSTGVFYLFGEHYEKLEKYYQAFFPELLLFVNNYYQKLLTTGKD